jgi:preprotein translocase subunit SecG
MSVFFTVLTFLFILVSIALVLVILVQRPQGGGLSSAFGGGGGTDTAFGGVCCVFNSCHGAEHI